MTHPFSSKHPHFSVFRSAAEEVANEIGQEIWENEGGRMSCVRGRVVRTPGSSSLYSAVLTDHLGKIIERPFATMRDAEAFIRRNTPPPAPRSTLFDRAAEEA